MAVRQYWRLFINASVGGSEVEVSELEFRAQQGVPLQSQGGTPSVSQTPLAAGSAFDGNVATTWYDGQNTNDWWISYDYGLNPIDCVEVAITCSAAPASAPENFLVQSSVDGVSWVTESTTTNETGWSGNEQRVFNFGGAGAATGASSLTLKHQIEAGAPPKIVLKHSIIAISQSSLVLSHQVINATGSAQAIIEHIPVKVGQISVELEHVANQLVEGDRWGLGVTLDEVDVSASITGRPTINMQGGAARIARFSMLNVSGVIDAQQWVKKAVTVNYETSTNGVTQTSHRRFTGIVDDASFDPVTKLTHFICTDDLQGGLENIEFDEIAQIIGGHHSDSIHSKVSNGWQYAQQRLESLAGYYDKDHFGKGRYYEWQAGTADITYGDSDIVHDSVVLTQATAREIINSVSIDIKYRYNRTWQRELGFRWDYGRSFDDYRSQSSTLPNRNMFLSAIGGEWIVKSCVFIRLPKTGVYSIAGQPASWNISDEDQSNLLFGAYGAVSKRWTQEIIETYTLEVSNLESVSRFGVVAKSERYTMDTPEPESNQTKAESDAIGNDVTGTVTTYSSVDYESPDLSATKVGHDYYVDSGNRADFDNAIETAIHIANTDILQSHHKNELAFTVWADHRLDLGVTVQVNKSDIQQIGTVTSITESYDFDRGSPTAVVTIGTYQPNATGQLNDLVTVPNRPAELIAEYKHDIELFTYLGGGSQTDPMNDSWRGYLGNYQGLSSVGAVIYPTEFRLEIPAIENDRRDRLEISKELNLNIAIPQEQLLLSA